MYKFSLSIFSSLLLFFFLFSSQTFAEAQPFNVTASPNAFDLIVTPGETIKKTIKLRNNTNAPLDLKIEIKKLLSDNTGQITLHDFKKEEAYKTWLTVEEPTFTAKPQEWTFIPIKIAIPKDAAFGYYWTILLSPKETPTSADGTTKITGALAIPVLLSVQKEGMKMDGKLITFTTSAGISEYLPVNFVTQFANLGNVHTKPRGSIFITDWRGKQVATIDINKEQGSVLPKSERTFTSIWNDSFITYEEKTEDGKVLVDSNGKAQKELKVRFDKILDLRIGKYTAHALVVVSGEERDIPFEATTTFFVFPWKIVLGILIFLALATIGLVMTIRSSMKTVKRWFGKK